MKSEHRHELKTNELADWLAHMPQWAKENLRMIIYIAVVIVLVVGVYVYNHYTKNILEVRKRLSFTQNINELYRQKAGVARAQMQGQDVSFTLIQTANKLRDLAGNTKDENLAVLALLKRGEALRTELHYRIGTLDTKNAQDQLEKAKRTYTEAVERAKTNNTLRALANFGVGVCEEELGNFDKAKQIYQDIIADPNAGSTVAAASAEHRLSVMDSYKQKVFFIKPKAPPPMADVPFDMPWAQPELPGTETTVPPVNLPAGP